MICVVSVFGEDDGVQYSEPDYEGGANIPSLRQVQKNYDVFEACEERCIEFVRKPNEKDVKDPNWKVNGAQNIARKKYMMGIQSLYLVVYKQPVWYKRFLSEEQRQQTKHPNNQPKKEKSIASRVA